GRGGGGRYPGVAGRWGCAGRTGCDGSGRGPPIGADGRVVGSGPPGRGPAGRAAGAPAGRAAGALLRFPVAGGGGDVGCGGRTSMGRRGGAGVGSATANVDACPACADAAAAGSANAGAGSGSGAGGFAVLTRRGAGSEGAAGLAGSGARPAGFFAPGRTADGVSANEAFD